MAKGLPKTELPSEEIEINLEGKTEAELQAEVEKVFKLTPEEEAELKRQKEGRQKLLANIGKAIDLLIAADDLLGDESTQRIIVNPQASFHSGAAHANMGLVILHLRHAQFNLQMEEEEG
jgi:hypothetical protein